MHVENPLHIKVFYQLATFSSGLPHISFSLIPVFFFLWKSDLGTLLNVDVCEVPCVWGGGGGGGPTTSTYLHNKPKIKILICQTEYSRSCERLGSCLVTECSTM